MNDEKEIKETSDDVVIEEVNDEHGEIDPSAQLKKLKEKLDSCLKEKQEYLDGWQRAKADFINTRKRDEESKKEAMKFANENLIVELIPVLDSFEMATGNKEIWEKVDKNWRTGVEYIYSQLKTVLAQNNLLELNPLGEKFDPMRDEAVAFEATVDESKNNVIIKVIQKGFSLADRVIKAPKVVVAEFKKNI